MSDATCPHCGGSGKRTDPRTGQVKTCFRCAGDGRWRKWEDRAWGR